MASTDGKFIFVHSCPDSTYGDMLGLTSSETSIELPTFRRAIGPEQWAWIQGFLGYDRSFPISRDWHVRYGKATYRDVPAVFLRHSRIEHIFTLNGRMGPSVEDEEEVEPSASSGRGMARGRAARRRQ